MLPTIYLSAITAVPRRGNTLYDFLVGACVWFWPFTSHTKIWPPVKIGIHLLCIQSLVCPWKIGLAYAH